MSNYSVGNLELSIQALDKSATSLNNVVSRLQSILNVVSPLSAGFKSLRSDMSAISRLKFGSFDRLATGLNSISKVNTQGLYTKLGSITRILTPLKDLSSGMASIGAVNNFANGLQKITKLDVAGFDTQIKSLTASLRPFLQEITVATPALTAFSNAMASVKGRRTISFKPFEDEDGDKKSKNFLKNLNLAGALGKIYFIRNYTKQTGQSMAGLVQSAIDYTETLNLWQVAMRGNISTAEEFISKMNKAYGIAEETLMRYQATFRNMLNTLGGISTDVSYGLSENLTQMALDYASLYNTSIEKAMTVFQSVLSGQVRPIRSISGYDITETTIFQLYQQLGGTKTMRQLTQSEKRLLRLYAVFQQMDRSGAIGDLNKTLNNTANQMRIMSESAKELGTWIGKMVEMYISPALPYLNAFLISARVITQTITKMLPNYSEFDGSIKGYQDTADAMDEVQGKLLDFDKFRSLSSGESEVDIGIDEKLIEGLSQYTSILENVNNKATELAENWLKIIGFEYDAESGVWGFGEKLSWLKDLLATISENGETFFNSEEVKQLISIFAVRLVGTLKEFLPIVLRVATSIASILSQIMPLAFDLVSLIFKVATPLFKMFSLSLDTSSGGGKGIIIVVHTLVRILSILEPILDIIYAVSWLISAIANTLVWVAQWLMTPFVIVLDFIAKIIQTVSDFLHSLLTWNWSELGDKIKSVWSNWGGLNEYFNQVTTPENYYPKYANGGMPEKGSMFIAGEAGAEMVYNNPNGQSGVANISQIAQADYNGTRQALNDWWASARNDIPAFREVSSTGIYEVVNGEAKRRGKQFANR